MSERWEPEAAPESRRRRRKPRPRTPEEQALREAQRAASRKLGFLAHAVPYAMTCLFLLFVSGFRPAVIVALAWGIGLACHYFAAVAAPRLRAQLVQTEVRRRVHADVSRERRSLEGEHARRLEELSASIAHEIRNPVTAAKSLVQQMGEDPASAENVEYASVALEELGRVERSISHLLRFAREEEVQLASVQIATLVDSALESFRSRFEAQGVAVELDLQDAGSLPGDVEKLRRVLLNLIGNALDAFQEGETERPQLRVSAGENLAGNQVWLRVSDNGPGMDRERLHRVFDPFYTSKRSGTGLGLAITKKLVDAHHGSLEVQSERGRGTEFLLTLPKQAEDSGP